MKNLRILAMVPVLALGFTLSAQAQSQDTTTSDQYTATQSTDQTTPMTASPDNSSMPTQQTDSTASSTSTFTNSDSDMNRERWTIEGRESDQVANRLQELQNDSGAN